MIVRSGMVHPPRQPTVIPNWFRVRSTETLTLLLPLRVHCCCRTTAAAADDVDI